MSGERQRSAKREKSPERGEEGTERHQSEGEDMERGAGGAASKFLFHSDNFHSSAITKIHVFMNCFNRLKAYSLIS